ncbi:hypothetical protein SGGMMB4_05230 [Sodalis glossinidius str. 'morsitans']|uniref:Nudix hydrolase domain-containing protein n=1 Tax=Sodalis glossinidius (strain morsitans) TaxID=343509 RepID=A0A193QNL4_SODGM|nr:NUDIX domain-containing protein [Sodalis glossinidius]CRL46510.1 hypothetical protein SGGMMB4_05230 [Sodalis glossinidius str. 'morsitans']
MADEKVIHIAAAVIIDARGRLLLVRKQNSVFLCSRVAKLRPETALVRELHEKLQLQIPEQQVTFLGQFTDIAANEPGHRLIADIFAVPAPDHGVTPATEIADVMSLDPSANPNVPLAPLTQKQLIPLLLQSQTVN